MKMVPCLDPSLCGVQNHKPTTNAKCRTGRGGSLVGIRASEPIVPAYKVGTNQRAVMNNRNIDRARQDKLNPMSSEEYTKYAYDAMNRGDGVTKIAIVSALLDNRTTDGNSLHLMLTGRKAGQAPLVGVNDSHEIIDHKNVQTRTLREIAKQGNPQIREIARGKLKYRVGFVRRVLRLY